MGGKKKTKWRKLPLEEFTKETPPKQEEKPLTDTCRTDVTSEENEFIPSYNGPPEIIQNYGEPYEYIDGIWYPTSCVVYNPSLFSNYVMPADTCYYYCTVPEAGQMPEYMPVPYQEYTPALPKDTVYLLLPTQTFRPAQPIQNIAPEWQNRRRRRRYEGYAEYAVIPEKTSSSKIEEKDPSRVPGPHENSRRKGSHFNNCRRMSSFSETSSSDSVTLEQNHVSGKRNETKKNPTNIDYEMSPNNENKQTSLPGSENNHISKKNLEMCSVHTARKGTANEQQAGNDKTKDVIFNDKLHQVVDTSNEIAEKAKQSDDPLATRIAFENTKNKKKRKERFNTVDNKVVNAKEISEHAENLSSSNQEIDSNAKTGHLKQKDDHVQQTAMKNESKEERILKTGSQNSLPDIVSSLTKTKNVKLQEQDNSCVNDLCDNIYSDKEKSPKPKPSTPLFNYTHNLFNSEALHNEMEMELSQLQSLKASQTNQSIYKLAYDENLTDQSSNSRSPSPVLRPEQNIPSSFTRNEIIVHEADSDDDAGSEDVELIPHRYESESYLNQLQNKNLYVNKLSLAVELLRTQENLPYDGEFKRIVGENNIEPSVHCNGKVNLGFRSDSCSPEKSIITNNIQDNLDNNTKHRNEITSQRQVNPSPDHSSDSAIFSDTDFNNFENESCESAKEIVCQANENKDITNEVRAGYRRIGIAQRQFSPLPFNPCFCCIIM